MAVSGRLESVVLAGLRIVAGLLFAFHGLQKLGLLSGPMVDLISLVGAAALLETIGGPLVAIGFLTRPTAFILSGQMAVAYFLSHQPRALLPIENGGELSILYCFIFLFFSVRGAGRWSLDSAKG